MQALAGLAVGVAAGALTLAWLDSSWAVLCALGFLGDVTLLGLYAGVADYDSRPHSDAPATPQTPR